MKKPIIDLTSDDEEVVIVSSTSIAAPASQSATNVIDLTTIPSPAPNNNESTTTRDILSIFQTYMFEGPRVASHRSQPYPYPKPRPRPQHIPATPVPAVDPPPVGALKCCICLSFASEGTQLVALNCGHIYDTKCIEELFKSSCKKSIPCPQCRKPFTKAKIVKLFTS